jgi:LPS-assembly lipoprotein
MQTLILIVLVLTLGGCGFQLRGNAQLPFAAAYVEAGNSPLARSLRQALSAQGKLAEQAAGAPVIIRLDGEKREKNILSLSGSGKVREYRIESRITLSARDAAGKELIAPGEVLLTRDMAYDDQQTLAKELEETELYRAMDRDALTQILRRLAYVQR